MMHYMAKLCGTLPMCLLRFSFPSTVVVMTSTLLGSLSARFWSVTVGIRLLVQPQEQTFVRQGSSQFIPEVFRAVVVRPLDLT